MSKVNKKIAEPGQISSPDLIWGIHPILELLRTQPRKIHSIQILQGKSGRKLQLIIDLARESGVKVKFVSRFKQPESSKMNHQGVIAQVMPHTTLTDDEFLESLKRKENILVLALDSIQDPHNLGAIIRTAVAAGVDGLILPKDRSASLTGTVVKISAGALSHLPICLTTNLVRMLQKLKDENIWICSSLKDAGQTVYSADLSVPVCLVIGSEEKGIRPLVRKQCDLQISIPMSGSVDSLNASVAAAVILFEIQRQRVAK